MKTDGHTEEDGEVIEPTCMHFLVLQDLCNGLDNPCALDVKMGRVTVEPGEREVRTEREEARRNGRRKEGREGGKKQWKLWSMEGRAKGRRGGRERFADVFLVWILVDGDG